MQNAHFFGYGSLVNRATHDFSPTWPARLTGWRRIWRHTHARQTPFLSVRRADDTTLDGLVAQIQSGAWPVLDQREAGYDRLPLAGGLTCAAPGLLAVHIYAVATRDVVTPAAPAPILLSYLDVVVQGYLEQFGTDGVTRFFATTDGWNIPVLDDRAAPRYPRHQPVGAAIRGLTEQALQAVGGRIIGPDGAFTFT